MPAGAGAVQYVRLEMRLDRKSLPLLGMVVLATLPHFQYLERWVLFVCVLVWLYIVVAVRRKWRLPPRPLLIAFSGILFIAALTTHKHLSYESFIALLSLMVLLKVLESNNSRDRMITVILCYFLLIGDAFFNDSLWMTFYDLVAVIGLTVIHVYIQFSTGSMRTSLKLTLSIALQAVPLVLIFFLFFPRFQGGIWGRTHVNTARSGFSDELSFGSISQLAQNRAVAFRVVFRTKMPEQNALYWRGVVLWNFDGRAWKRKMNRFSSAPPLEETSRPVSYTIVLEPHNEHWLFTLDLPVKINLRRSRIFYDFTTYRWRPITGRLTYDAESFLSAKVPSYDYYKEMALQLPRLGNPRSRILAERMLGNSKYNQEYIRRVLDFFRDNSFYYTLTPPSLLTDEDQQKGGEEISIIDRFLFDTRQGYCEHYAGSFAFLMRAAGIPARVIVGYQGGTYNQYGEYMIVRQSNAHAWCEVWLEDKGWVRIDPTEVVAPERFRSVAGNIGSNEKRGFFFTFWNRWLPGSWLDNVQDMVDYYNAMWNQKVMSYSAYEQESFFGNMGINIRAGKGLVQAVLAFTLATISIVIVVNLILYRRPKQSDNEVGAIWEEFCRKLANAGLARRTDQGPFDYQEYISSNRPDLALQVTKIASAYIALQYNSDAGEQSLADFKQMVRTFSP